MLKHIFSFRKDLENKEIYVWDVGKKAVWVFTYLAFRGVNVKGFVTDQESFIGDSVLTLPVISAEAFSRKPGGLLILENTFSADVFSQVSEYGSCLYLKDALELNPDLREKPVYIYGNTAGAWNLLKTFSENHVAVQGFLLSKMNGPSEILGLPVRSFNDARLTAGDSLVISSIQDHVTTEILSFLMQSGYAGDLYISEIVSCEEIWGTDPIAMLDDAARNGKQIFFCCEDPLFSELVHRVFSLYGIPIDREVCYDGDPDRGLEDIWSLAGEDPDQSVLLIHSWSDLRRYEIVDAANDLGYSAGSHNYASFKKCNYNRLLPSKTLAYEKDTRLEYSLDYSELGGLPGWHIRGSADTASLRILVLGGSTSSEVYYPENWVSKLFKRLDAAGIDAVIYNGAHEGNTVLQEFLRLTRDLSFLNPDIVISLSGVNDLYCRDNRNRFEPFRRESAHRYWVRMERYMKAVCEAEGAQFISVLQPFNVYMENPSLREELLFVAEPHRPGEEYLSEIRKDDFYLDLSGLFHHKEGMFIDNCHYSDEAAEILAEILFNEIRSRM